MKLIIIGILTMLSANAQDFHDRQKDLSDSSPNSNGLLRTPAANGTTTRAGASFGPEPIIKNASDENSNTKNELWQNDRKNLMEKR